VATGDPQAAHALRGERPLIFVTVGTHHQPFQRLLDALGSLPPAELVVQFGHGSPPAGVRQATAFMGFGEMLEHFSAANAVVTHAGVGSILCARRAGHVPVVVPRQRRYSEHVDDHQLELTRALDARGAVVAVWDVDRLAAAVASAAGRGSRSPAANGRLPQAVRAALL
jgi:exopolysaccharide biosynthesis glucuronosyltransferase PssE